MTLEFVIETYGYPAVLIGTFIEGETVLVIGGLAAHLGYLKLPWVIVAAFIGSLSGDQLFFYLGRRHGQTMLAKHPAWQVRVEKVHKLLDGYSTSLIIGFRFLYGLRTVTPFVIGMSRVPTRVFILLNAAGAVIWAVAVGTGGYLFGHALEAIIGDIKRYEHYILAAIVIIGLLTWVIYFYRRRLHKPARPGCSPTRSLL